MNAATFAFWTLLSGAPGASSSDVIPPGLYPASFFLEAYYACDHRPLKLADGDLGQRPIWLRFPLDLRKKPRRALELLIRSTKLHLLPWRDLGGEPYLYVTDDPNRAPKSAPKFQVEIIPLRYIKAGTAARLLNEAVGEEEKSLAEIQGAREPVHSHFVADPRSQSLLVRFASRERLERYRQLIRILDAPGPRNPPPERIILRSWKARHARVTELALLLEEVWEKEGEKRLTVVPHLPSNTLLMRLSPKAWPKVQKLLKKLDVEC